MNICLASGEYPPENGWGGVATYTHTMANALAKLGHRVFVVAAPAPNAPAKIQRGEVEIHRIQLSSIHYYAWRLGLRAFQLSKIIKRLEYQIAVVRKLRELDAQYHLDIVEYPDSYADGLLHRRFCRIPYVVKMHVPYWVLMQYYGNEKAAIIGRMEEIFVRNATAIVSPSRYLADETAHRYGIARERIAVIPNPVDTDVFALRPSGTPTRVRILFVGWLTRIKGVDVLVDAIPRVFRQCPEVQFVFVGHSPNLPNQTGFDAQTLKNLRDEQSAGCVTIKDFVRDRIELSELYNTSSVCVVPSRYDNFPNVCLEAMACARPIIASGVGGIPEIVEDGRTGILTTAGDADELADAIVRLARDPSLRERMGRAGRAKATREFDPIRVAEQNLKVYEHAKRTFERSNV